MKIVLGISSFFHDSAAALICDGNIIAAAQEERFTRIKHDSSFPLNAIKYILEEWGGVPADIDSICFYEKPFLKFERILENVHSFAPKGLGTFLQLVPEWLGHKLNIRKTISYHLKELGIKDYVVYYPEHHLSHAASAFYPSPFDESAIVTIDGVGEWATTTIMHGKQNSIEKLKEIKYPHSLGLLYSAFTSFCGFKVNDGEYKLMGLAPYSDSDSLIQRELIEKIKSNLIKIYPDGSFVLDIKYFTLTSMLTIYHEKKWTELFHIGPNKDTSLTIDPLYIHMSAAIQKITEEIYSKIICHAKDITQSNNLCLSGGVALNCVANGMMKELNLFENIWIQPAAGDAGSAIGCALATYYINSKKNRITNKIDTMEGSLLGPSYSTEHIKKSLDKKKANYIELPDNELYVRVAKLISEGNIIGWFKDRMEFGPRALGNRSILADARNPSMQKIINQKIKFREQFRPFAPIVLEEDAEKYFQFSGSSNYMLFVAKIHENITTLSPENYSNFSLREKLYLKKSTLPSITHVNYTARLQTISKESNQACYHLLKEFKRQTTCSVLINTSFNQNNEPIVCSPEDAYNCFMNTGIDFLIIDNFLLEKKLQSEPR
ncbi:MAG: hypothetical protein HN576_16475 [Bacteriovoracaceae bacterium]|jgi:carbamoyltransferase|nr:hypothetical protein [Bacteriovoracaceae bacterium]